MKEREIWIDYAKVIGIILVIIGHLALTSNKAILFIYAFHIPLFFLVSGYLHKNRDSFGTAVKKDTKRLLLPYVYFYLISYGYWLATVYLKHRSEYPGTFLHAGVIRPLMGMLVGVGYETPVSISINHPLWFLIALFFIKLIYNLVTLITKNNKLFIGIGIAILVGVIVFIKSAGYDLWFSLDSAILGLPFFFAGILLKDYGSVKTWFKNNLLNTLYFILFAAITWFVANYNGRVDINGTIWGQNIFVFYLNGLAGIFMIISISFMLSSFPNKFILFVSANTLVLMCIQSILKSISIGILKVAKYPLPLKLNLVQAGVLTITILILSIPAMYLIDKYLPFLAGADIKKNKPVLLANTM